MPARHRPARPFRSDRRPGGLAGAGHRGGALAAVLITVAAAVLAGCTSTHSAAASGLTSGPISFAVGAPSPALTRLVASWNSSHADQQVTVTSLPADSSDRRDQLVEQLGAKAAGFDVIDTDLTQTAELASHGWLVPRTGKLATSTGDLVPVGVTAGSYRGALYAVPFSLDTGLLYYRSDLLTSPPTTWADVAADCGKARAVGIGCFAGQYAQGPDLTRNVLEALDSGGGSLLSADGKTFTADTAANREALQVLVDAFTKNEIPAAAITYRVSQSVQAFASGSLLMLRATAASAAELSSRASQVATRFAIAPLPGRQRAARALVAGDGLSIGVQSAHRTTAAAFIDYLTSSSSEQALLAAGVQAPSLSASYTDTTLRQHYPFLATMSGQWAEAVPLLVSPVYQGISDALDDAAYGVLSGSTSVAAATRQLQSDLSSLAAQ